MSVAISGQVRAGCPMMPRPVHTPGRTVPAVRGASGGFTLLELLVALAIFAVAASIAYQGLASVLKARERAQAQAAVLADLQRAFTIMARDIEQAVARDVRDEFGDTRPSMLGEGLFGSLIELTRTGWRNPAGQTRSHLQRVAYIVRDEQLLRLSWPVLDGASQSEPFANVLLEPISEVEVRFLDSNAQWVDHWPAAISSGTTPADPRPRAVEVTISTGTSGEIKRLFRVPGT